MTTKINTPRSDFSPLNSTAVPFEAVWKRPPEGGRGDEAPRAAEGEEGQGGARGGREDGGGAEGGGGLHGEGGSGLREVHVPFNISAYDSKLGGKLSQIQVIVEYFIIFLLLFWQN